MKYVVVRVIIIIVTFMVLAGIFTTLYVRSQAESDTLACNLLIRNLESANDNTLSLSSLFYKIRDKCKIQEIEIDDGNKKDETFRQISQAAKDGWEKYGRGKYEFMNRFKTKDWCFLSSVITFDEGGNIYDYNEFIQWTRTHGFDNGSEKIDYFDYLGLMYFDESNTEQYMYLREEAMSSIKNLKKGDATQKDFAKVFADTLIGYENLRLRQIDTNNKLFVVYRYGKVPKKFSEKMKHAMIGTMATMVASMVVSEVIEYFITSGIGIITAPFKIAKITGTANEVSKVAGIMNKISGTVKYTDEAGDFAKIMNRIGEIREMHINDIGKVSAKLKNKGGKLKKFGKYFEEIELLLRKNGVKSVSELERKVFEGTVNINLGGIIRKSKKLPLDSSIAKDSKKVEKLIKNIDNSKSFKSLSKTKKRKVFDFMRSSFAIGAGITGGFAAMKYNDNSLQYIDIMPPEEYYRVCGG